METAPTTEMAETYHRLIVCMSLGMLMLCGCAASPSTAPVQARDIAAGSATPAPAPETEAPEINPASQALIRQAIAQHEAGDRAGAEASLERALRIDSRNPQIWLELSRLRLMEENFVQAENLSRKALSLAGSNKNQQAAAWRLIAGALRGQGRVQEAREAEAKAAL